MYCMDGGWEICVTALGKILSQNNRPVALELLPLKQTRPSPQRLILLLTTPKKGFALHAERYLVEKICTIVHIL